MEYSIGDFSKLTGLGIHTLRYYEQECLITPERNSSNRRRYSDKDIAGKIKQLLAHQVRLDEKIDFYNNQIEKYI